MLDRETRTVILRLRAEGQGIVPIAKALKVSVNSVRKVLTEATVEVPQMNRLSTARPHQGRIVGAIGGGYFATVLDADGVLPSRGYWGHPHKAQRPIRFCCWRGDAARHFAAPGGGGWQKRAIAMRVSGLVFFADALRASVYEIQSILLQGIFDRGGRAVF